MHWFSALCLVGALLIVGAIVLNWLEWILSDEGDPYE